MDLEASSTILEVSIEDKFFNYLLNYFKTFKVMPSEVEMHVPVDEFIPINILPYAQIFSNRVHLRTLKIMPFQLLLNLHWSAVCFISFNHLLFRFTEYGKNYMNASLCQLGQSASIHYYNYLVDNVENAMGSLELLGATNNFVCMAKKGLRDFTSMTSEGFFQGPKGFLFGISNGVVSLTKHLSLGLFMIVSSCTNSWSRTLSNNSFLKCITYPVIKVMKTLDVVCKWSIDYLLYPVIDSDVN